MLRSFANLLLLASLCMEDQAEDERLHAGAPVRQSLPEKYVLDYPAMTSCSVPTRSTFFDASSTFNIVNWHRFRYQPNGGYGLPVADKVGGKNLLHVGADLGWYQVGEPVFAIGAGVVRVSQGPPIQDKKSKDKPSNAKATRQESMPWGNVVMIEHRLSSGEYFTTIYGHLDSRRRVAVGDVVQPGQCIGTIGRKSPQINGGYNPHLHFGVREGRMIKIGTVLFRMNYAGADYAVKLAEVHEDLVELELPVDRPDRITFRCDGEELVVEERDGKPCLPSRMLWHVRDPSFPLVGYALTTDGWRDPIEFLRENHAAMPPAR
jgi:murein DD-endopeptidase MepM/ murein hydrolase activator NlpD